MKSHEIFESNPDLKEVHVTSDGTPFYNANDAKNHAKALADKAVELVINPLVLEVIVDEADSEELEATDQSKTGDEITSDMRGFEATADGSVITITEGSTGGAPIGDLPTLSADETKDFIQSGAQAINAPEVPSIETLKAETPKANTKNSK